MSRAFIPILLGFHLKTCRSSGMEGSWWKRKAKHSIRPVQRVHPSLMRCVVFKKHDMFLCFFHFYAFLKRRKTTTKRRKTPTKRRKKNLIIFAMFSMHRVGFVDPLNSRYAMKAHGVGLPAHGELQEKEHGPSWTCQVFSVCSLYHLVALLKLNLLNS